MESSKVRTEVSVPERKYQKELRDAWSMITCSPEHPTGYLIAGHCYKDHGKQEKAIEIFNMGLNHVPIKHKEYEALLQGKQEADESRKNCRMDILGQLPLEIIHYIFDNYFDQDSITPCSRVCSTWRNIILDYSKFWKRILFESHLSEDDELSPHHMLLPSISQHIEEIKIIHNSQLSATLIELFQTTKFPKMRSLKIKHHIIVYDYKGPMSYAEFPSILNAFSMTLTTLDLDIVNESTNLPSLSDILNNCNNLTTLRYVLVKPEHPVFLPITLATQQNTSLKELLLSSHCKKDKMNRTELQKLLKYSPHLSHLAIQNCDDSIYTAVREHGQSINKLQVLHDHYSYNCRFDIELNNHDNIALYNNSPGLKYIEISSIDSPRTLLQLIKNHHHTLSFLSIRFNKYSSSSDNDWKKWTEDLHVFPLTNLTEFYLINSWRSASLACEYILPAIITRPNDNNSVINQQAPNLQALILYNVAVIPNNVLDAITKMSHFTKLDLTGCSFDFNKLHDVLKIFERRSYNNSISTATTTTSLPPPSSPLKELYLNDVFEMNDDVILTASKIKSLTDLSIEPEYHEDCTFYKALAQNISKLPLLKSLCLSKLP
ncbi:hypothetical protein INT45_011128 [Circinella minor]|uniref:F-box domain-containing protein n=1 Tax=Circinella minor TaxID=1195481 RepID=A0A8H7VMP8_9FUNG|nr:hypothetical protein INT45_011128 [Circinella minor]